MATFTVGFQIGFVIVKQRVVLNGKFSDWHNVSSGVPQGSVLGPILFLIYINDLDEEVKCKISKFADDTKIANRVIPLSQQQELQNDLNTLSEWAVDSQMFFLTLINVKFFILVIEMFRPTIR